MGHPIAFSNWRIGSRKSRAAGAWIGSSLPIQVPESVDTALKIAIAYHRARGAGQRTRLIGREKGYHGVGFGGMSVGGMVNNRKFFGSSMLPGVDHLPHTLDIEHNAFSRGIPQWGMHLANELERLIALHDASTIAAVIVEPISGSAGVVLPPAGYLKRLREICDKHDILLIFDEVITGFGRVGKPFASQAFDVTPDLITTAKGLTNGAVPMGAVFSQRKIYDAFMQGPENSIELFHGYTYSAHRRRLRGGPGVTQDIYAKEGLLRRGQGRIERPVGRRRAFPARPAACHRHSKLWVDRRRGLRSAPGKTRGARLRGISRVLRAGCQWSVKPAIPSRWRRPW